MSTFYRVFAVGFALVLTFNNIEAVPRQLQDDVKYVAPACQSCEELGWSLESGDPEVCGESDDGIECTTEVTFPAANRACRSIGARLCSATELELGEAQGTGCGHDALQVWSHSNGLGDVKCGDGEKATVLGHVGIFGGATTEEVICVARTETAAVRCCADVECIPEGEPYVCKDCEELGWSLESGDPEVCGESDDGFECMEEVAYADGAELCRGAGARLCTSIELELGEGQGTGCGHDGRLIWSKSRTLHDELQCGATEKVAVHGTGLEAPACVHMTGGMAAVRCCADLECEGKVPAAPAPVPAPAPCKTCKDLKWHLDGGDPEVCGESDDGIECTSEVKYNIARRTCASIGARLCSATELELGEGTGTGCGHDAMQVWSSSNGLGDVKCGHGEKATVRGRVGVFGGATVEEVDCVAKIGTAATRCCADLECLDADVLPPAPTPYVCKDCEELGWSLESGDPEVCGESDDGFECTQDVAYIEAEALCATGGARLCTATELELGEGQGTGCGHNARMIWSESRRLDSARCGVSERMTVSGGGRSEPACLDKEAGLAAVRCCADLECSDNSAPSPPATGDCTMCTSAEDVLIISEVGEGSGNNKWVEIYNPTDHAVSLTKHGATGGRYYLMGFNNGQTTLAAFPERLGQSQSCILEPMADGSENPCLTGMIPARGLYLICNNQADDTALSPKCHHRFGGQGINFNGNDFLVLARMTPEQVGTTGALASIVCDEKEGASGIVASDGAVLKPPEGVMDVQGLCGDSQLHNADTIMYRRPEFVTPTPDYQPDQWDFVDFDRSSGLNAELSGAHATICEVPELCDAAGGPGGGH